MARFGGRIKDRRTEPSFGYRAVHIAFEDDTFWIEVQVRTRLQDVWAQGMEGLSELWGREIQYGGPPDANDEQQLERRVAAVDQFKALSPIIARAEVAMDEQQAAQAELDDAATAGEVLSPERERWLRDHVAEAGAEVDHELVELRTALDRYTEARG